MYQPSEIAMRVVAFVLAAYGATWARRAALAFRRLHNSGQDPLSFESGLRTAIAYAMDPGRV